MAVVAVMALGADRAAARETWGTLTVAPEHRCAPYDRGDYPCRQSVESRLEGGTVRHAIAVRVPELFHNLDDEQAREALEAGEEIEYALPQSQAGGERRFPANGFLRGTVTDMAPMAGAMALGTCVVEETVAEVKGVIEQHIWRMEERLDPETQTEITGRLMQWSHLSGLSAPNVLWLDALLTRQERARYGVRGMDGGRIPGIPPSTQSLGWSVERQIGGWLSVGAELFARVRQARARRAPAGEHPIPSPDHHQGIAETPDKQHRGAFRNV